LLRSFYFSLAKASSSFKMGDSVRVVTPTGNFGNILAGYFAKKMGLPVEKLVGTFIQMSLCYVG
jgi:threonine synthase